MTYLIEATAILATAYFATCFVVGFWNYQPRHVPTTPSPTPQGEGDTRTVELADPKPYSATANHTTAPTMEVLPPDNAQQHLQQHTIRQLKAIATDLNRRLGKRHPNRVRNVGRSTKPELVEALLPRYEALRLVG